MVRDLRVISPTSPHLAKRMLGGQGVGHEEDELRLAGMLSAPLGLVRAMAPAAVHVFQAP